MTNKKTTTIVLAALLAALTFVGTMIIRIPTPTGGYIHPGDGFVLLSGLILGPVWGFLAAAIGSALTDLVGGYMVFVPGTFVIKGLVALVGSLLYKLLAKAFDSKKLVLNLIITGIVAELIMVLGYFVYEIFLLAEAFTPSALAAGAAASAAGIPANLIQAAFGVFLATIVYPVIRPIILRLN